MIAANFFSLAVLGAGVVLGARAETHTVSFVNNCGFGTPILEVNGQTVSTGQSVTFNGPVMDAIAFLQTGGCGDNGEDCALVEITLENSTSPGSVSSGDILLIPPHQFSVPTSFEFIGAMCTGSGASCPDVDCGGPGIGRNPDDPQVVCVGNNVGVVITFCN
ncbi:glycopeptide [Phanerochaete sordida]|uniref:Glycopeptide n=1 Tax=Phanerochaete sordida TaxID=48140 RepID=A0A9P3LKU8_9APHY|nr:glycopeptide [Phanerochaete sordida]